MANVKELVRKTQNLTHLVVIDQLTPSPLKDQIYRVFFAIGRNKKFIFLCAFRGVKKE